MDRAQREVLETVREAVEASMLRYTELRVRWRYFCGLVSHTNAGRSDGFIQSGGRVSNIRVSYF